MCNVLIFVMLLLNQNCQKHTPLEKIQRNKKLCCLKVNGLFTNTVLLYKHYDYGLKNVYKTAVFKEFKEE